MQGLRRTLLRRTLYVHRRAHAYRPFLAVRACLPPLSGVTHPACTARRGRAFQLVAACRPSGSVPLPLPLSLSPPSSLFRPHSYANITNLVSQLRKFTMWSLELGTGRYDQESVETISLCISFSLPCSVSFSFSLSLSLSLSLSAPWEIRFVHLQEKHQ